MSEKTIIRFIEKYTLKTKAPAEDNPDAHNVWLKIDQQSFRIATETEDAQHADWFRRQLAIALVRLVEQEGKK